MVKQQRNLESQTYESMKPPIKKEKPFPIKINSEEASGISFNSRPRSGKFEQIFPFNKVTEDLAINLNRLSTTSSGTATMMGGPNYMKLIIQEVRRWEIEYNEYINSQ